MTTIAANTPRVAPADKSMDEIVALCKRRGFIYPASEIYGGINGFWDYGPLGVALKNNLRDRWWRDMVKCPPVGPDGRELQIVGVDTAIIQNPRVWEASGHVQGFNDPMQTCRQCKKLFRADQVGDMLKEAPWVKSLVEACGLEDWERSSLQGDRALAWARGKGRKLAPGLALVRTPAPVMAAWTEDAAADPERQLPVPLILQYLATEQKARAGLLTPCPNCGGDMTDPRPFNLMFESHTGAVKDEADRVYLRPETAQGIFTNYKNVLDTTRVRVPFGIAQIGKSFRNEVNPRNFIFRTREFEQMEMEWFCRDEEAPAWYEFWVQTRLDWWASLGVDLANLRRRDHQADELAHYSTACADIEYQYPFTAPQYGELEGVAHRGCFDLSRHQEFSGIKLDYFDQERSQRYMPHVIEPAAGLTRGVLVLLTEAYTPDPSRPSGVVLRFDPALAPIQVAVYPLVNKDGMPEVAERLYHDLRRRYTVEFDAKQTIGKRYARMDEAGTPFCFTIDGQTLQDQTVTVRHRDTTQQERIAIDQVRSFLEDRMGGV